MVQLLRDVDLTLEPVAPLGPSQAQNRVRHVRPGGILHVADVYGFHSLE